MILALLYLALAAATFVAALGVLYPKVFGRVLAPLVSLVAMAHSLFAPQLLLAGAAVTGVAWWLGALRHPLGMAGLCLHASAWALLLVHLWNVHRCLPELDGRAVADADHPFADGLSDEELARLAPARVAWGPSLTWKVPSMLGVEVTRDVVYREVGGVRLRVDVYRLPGLGARRPAALYIHGGGWVTGSRRQSRFMMYELAAAGYVVFAISYRRAPRFPLPAAIEDCKYALAWIREHGESYGAAGDDVVVLGGSAGGHLAAMLAVTPNDPRFQPGFEQADTRVKAAVVFYGVPDLESAFGDRPHPVLATFLERAVFRARYRDAPEVFRLAQPMTHVSASAPPILLVHGAQDALVPIRQSRDFAAKLRAAGAPRVHLLEVPIGLHAFEVVPSPLHQRTMRVIVRFLASLSRTG